MLFRSEEDNWRSWDKTDLPVDRRLTTGTEATEVALDLAAFAVGHYLAEWVVVAENGDTIRAEQYFRLSDRAAGALPTGVLLSVEPPGTALELGARNTLQLLTSEPTSHVLTVLSGRERREGPQWLPVDPTGAVSYPVAERDRGGLIWDLAYVRYNRFYRNRYPVPVPWSNKKLDISFATFRDRLRPGDPETWTIRIGGPDRDALGAEVLASMYDASLDQILPFDWEFGAWPSYRNSTVDIGGLLFGAANGQGYDGRYRERLQDITVPRWEYPTLKQQIVSGLFGYAVARGRERLMMARAEPAMAPDAAQPVPYAQEAAATGKAAVAAEADTLEEPAEREPEATVSPRTNLRETAFFFPQIKTDAAGNVVLSFTTPEALTRWKLQVFAHTPALATALDQREIVTQKELMILPNAPRFLREGDQIELTAKVSNLSEGELAGTASLELFDLDSGASLNEAYGIADPEVAFKLAPAGSAPVAWRLDVPRAAAGSLGYRVTATAGSFSDGEENALPVLTNRVLVTETQAFYVSGKTTKEVALEALATATSDTREDKSFTVELTSNPSWLALKSLPYLMEYPYQCTEQIVNRFFANRLAASVVAQTPRLQDIFARWRQDPAALESPLALNQELKSALLAETPWVLDAQDEARQRANLAILFDIERMAREQNEALAQLVQRQSADGTYSWFPDGRPNRYMTQYVVESLIRLQQLEVLNPAEVTPANRILQRAVPALDRFLLKEYQQLQEAIEKGRTEADEDHLSRLGLHYLYVRTRLDGITMDQEVQPAYEYYLGQAETYWADRGLQEQALVALALNAAERPAQVNEIMQSFRERALRKAELGMYWKYNRGFFWHNRPLETHTYLMEAFQELGGTAAELDAMRLWLLSNKRTNRWETTKATAAAIYALLNGMDRTWLDATPDRLRVSFPELAKEEYADRLDTGLAEAEAGTGTFRLRWTDGEVKPALATLRLRNRNRTVAWGGMFWQYLEDIDRVERAANNPLQLERQHFRRVNTDRGTELQPLAAGTVLRPGDRLTVRLTVRTDRDMEFIHLKDLRGAGLESVESLSGYRYAGGLGYYFSPTDLAVNYFIDDLPRGTYVLEYDQFVIHRGTFSNGLSTVQCMYAPEFSGHSAGTRLEVAAE